MNNPREQGKIAGLVYKGGTVSREAGEGDYMPSQPDLDLDIARLVGLDHFDEVPTKTGISYRPKTQPGPVDPGQ